MQESNDATDATDVPDTDDATGWPEWQSFVDSHGYLSWLGVRVESLGKGRAVLAIDHDEEFENPVGNDGYDPIHGSIVATLIDTASAFALRSTFDDPSGAGLTTTDQRLVSPAGDRRPPSRSGGRPRRQDVRRHAGVGHRRRRRGGRRPDDLSTLPERRRRERG